MMGTNKIQYKLRTPKDLHEWARDEAKNRYQSLNSFFVEILRRERERCVGTQDR